MPTNRHHEDYIVDWLDIETTSHKITLFFYYKNFQNTAHEHLEWMNENLDVALVFT